MNREVHARICGGLGVRFPWATRLRIFAILQIPSTNHNLGASCDILLEITGFLRGGFLPIISSALG